MDQAGPILLVVGVIALIGGIAYLAWLMEKKRTEAMSAWAQAHGFVFEGERPQLVDEIGRAHV
jgi:flagellar basal body-associated protein FliL